MQKWIPHVFIIHLDSAKDRLPEAIKQCEKVGINKPIVFRATDGMSLVGKFKCNSTNSKIPGWTRGAAGLADTLSRLMCHCLADPSIEEILILEDDIQFSDNVTNIKQTISNLPNLPKDWEYVTFGANVRKPLKHVSGHIYAIPPFGVLSAHCVAIRRPLFRLLELEFAKLKEPIDITYARVVFARGKAYAFQPNIAFQRPGFSHILNRHVNYDYLHDER